MPEKVELTIGVKDEASAVLEGIGGKIEGMSGQLKKAGIIMTAVGGVITGALALSIKSFADTGDAVLEMSQRTGFSTEALSELKYAAELSGASLSSIETAAKRMAVTIMDASSGSQAATDALGRLGLVAQDLIGLAPEKQFDILAMSIAGIPDPTARAAAAIDIFGRSGTDLLPMLADGVAGLDEMRQKARDLGIVFDEETAKKADAFNDALATLKGSGEGIKNLIAEALIPTLTDLAGKVTEVVKWIQDWSKEHPVLFDWIVKITGVVGLLTLALGTMALVASTRLIPTMIALIAVLWAKVAALIATTIALGPVGWAAAAVSMAMITGGLILLYQQETRELAKLTAQTDLVTAGVNQITNAQRELAKATAQTTEEQKRQFELSEATKLSSADLAIMSTVSQRLLLASYGLLEAPPEAPYPEAPYFQHGGIMPYTGLAYLHKGETVTPAHNGGDIINIYLDGARIDDTLIARLERKLRYQGVM